MAWTGDASKIKMEDDIGPTPQLINTKLDTVIRKLEAISKRLAKLERALLGGATEDP